MYIEGYWETVNTLSDISRIVREYYNDELADKMDELLASIKISDYELERLEEL
jgi:hypothetical protein